MEEDYEVDERLKRKKALLLTCVRARFEDSVYTILEHGDFNDMDSVDQQLDELLVEYDNVTKAIRSYYRTKIETDDS